MLPKGRSVADAFFPQIVQARMRIVDKHVQAVDEADGSVQELSLITMNDAPGLSLDAWIRPIGIGPMRDTNVPKLSEGYRIGPLRSRNPTTASFR